MSSSIVRAAAERILDGLVDVPGIRRYTDLDAAIDPPAVVLGSPVLLWNAMGPDPSEARFGVYVVVPRDAQTMERLWDLVPLVVVALEEVCDLVSRNANPTSYPTGTIELPAYLIETEVTL